MRIDPECIDASISEEQAATTDFIIDNIYPNLDPTLYIQFSGEDSKLISDYKTSLETYVTENIQKFIIGQRDIAEWDVFQTELLEMPIAELLAVYEKAYDRAR